MTLDRTAIRVLYRVLQFMRINTFVSFIYTFAGVQRCHKHQYNIRTKELHSKKEESERHLLRLRCHLVYCIYCKWLLILHDNRCVYCTNYRTMSRNNVSLIRACVVCICHGVCELQHTSMGDVLRMKCKLRNWDSIK